VSINGVTSVFVRTDKLSQDPVIDHDDIVNLIKTMFHNRFLVFTQDPLLELTEKTETTELTYPGIKLVPYIPTTENISQNISDIVLLHLKPILGDDILVETELSEAEASYSLIIQKKKEQQS
jgi:hypothetical protein